MSRPMPNPKYPDPAAPVGGRHRRSRNFTLVSFHAFDARRLPITMSTGKPGRQGSLVTIAVNNA